MLEFNSPVNNVAIDRTVGMPPRKDVPEAEVELEVVCK